MEFSKPIWEVNRELASEVGRILKEAIRPEQCARMFAELDKTHPDVHELINRHQSATGNDATTVCSVLMLFTPRKESLQASIGVHVSVIALSTVLMLG